MLYVTVVSLENVNKQLYSIQTFLKSKKFINVYKLCHLRLTFKVFTELLST